MRGLTEDLQIARALGSLSFHLREMVLRKSSLARLSEDFVWLCLRAARDDAVIHLWKVFDTSRRARSLPWYIKKFSKVERKLILADLARLSSTNDDVRRLQRLRHDVVAHRATAGPQDADKVLIEHNLSEVEFLNLVREAHRILRVHSGGPLVAQVVHDERDAIDQLIDLDMYLVDAIPGRWGIERLELELDGSVTGRRRFADSEGSANI